MCYQYVPLHTKLNVLLQSLTVHTPLFIATQLIGLEPGSPGFHRKYEDDVPSDQRKLEVFSRLLKPTQTLREEKRFIKPKMKLCSAEVVMLTRWPPNDPQVSSASFQLRPVNVKLVTIDL